MLGQIRVHAAYQPVNDWLVEVTSYEIRFVGDGDDQAWQDRDGSPGKTAVFEYAPQKLDNSSRVVSHDRLAVATLHEVDAFESVTNLVVLIPCDRPQSAIVADHGFRADIGRSFVFALEPVLDDEFLLIGRNQGSDASDYWGDVWVADVTVSGRLQVLARLGYSSGDTGATMGIDSYSHDPATGDLVLQLLQRGRSGKRPLRLVELTLPLD